MILEKRPCHPMLLNILTVLCSVVKHAGISRVRKKKCFTKEKSTTEASLCVLNNPFISPHILLIPSFIFQTMNKTRCFNQSERALYIYRNCECGNILTWSRLRTRSRFRSWQWSRSRPRARPWSRSRPGTSFYIWEKKNSRKNISTRPIKNTSEIFMKNTNTPYT